MSYRVSDFLSARLATLEPQKLFSRMSPADGCLKKISAPNQGGKCGVGQSVTTRPAKAALWQVPGLLSSVGGSGRLRDPHLPDLCLGIVSEIALEGRSIRQLGRCTEPS
jgi:hypothetical protein